MKECPPVLAAVFRSIGIGVPVCEYRFDPERKWRFDFAWLPDESGRGNRIALEQEGGAWTHGHHNRGKGFVDDMEKYNRAAALGWRVLRCTPQQLANGDILADLAEAMTWMTVSEARQRVRGGD